MLPFSTRSASAQNEVVKDHSLTFEIGSAAEWDISGSSSQFGGTLAVEKTPIENWLELEGGVTVLQASNHAEVGLDLLFKKPYRLSTTAEFMLGVGPEVVQKFGVSEHTANFDIESVLDFMFWPGSNIGWYVEPSYDSGFGPKSERSWGATAGLLIGFQ